MQLQSRTDAVNCYNDHCLAYGTSPVYNLCSFNKSLTNLVVCWTRH